MDKRHQPATSVKRAPARPGLAVLVRQRWVPDALAVAGAALMAFALHLGSPAMSKLNDWLLNDPVWGGIPVDSHAPGPAAPVAAPASPRVVPQNLVVVDLGEWPDPRDPRPAAQAHRDEIGEKILQILRLTAHPKPADRPRAIGFDMTFQSLPSPPIREELLTHFATRSEIFTGAEFTPAGVSIPGNPFWQGLRRLPGFSRRLAAINLESYVGEPIRRYRIAFTDPVLGQLPSFGARLATDLELPGTGRLKSGPSPRRIRFRYLLDDTVYDTAAAEAGWDNAGGVPILSLDAVIRELIESGGAGLGPVPVAGSVLLFGVAGRNPASPDRHSVCVYGVRPNQPGRFTQPQPGVLVHVNAAVSLLADRPVGFPPEAVCFLIAALPAGLLALARRRALVFSDRFPVWGNGVAAVLCLTAGAVVLLAAWWAGEWAAVRYDLEVPLGTALVGLPLFFLLRPALDWGWRQGVLRGAAGLVMRGFPGFIRKGAADVAAAADPQRQFNAALDLFQTAAALMAFRRISALMATLSPDARSAERTRRVIRAYLVRPTIGKHRAVLRDLAGPGGDPLVTADPSGEADRAFDRLLDARNRFRHRTSAALSSAEWRQSADTALEDLFFLLHRVPPLLGGELGKTFSPTGDPCLVSPGPDGEADLFPLVQELECDLHGRREIFAYASGLPGDGEPIHLEGPVPGCTPRVDPDTLRRSFDGFLSALTGKSPGRRPESREEGLSEGHSPELSNGRASCEET